MANYYVIGNGTTAPNLTGTPYEGYTIKTVSQFNWAYEATNGTSLRAGDNVVISGSVNENINLNPSFGQSTGFQINVTVLENSNSFNIAATNLPATTDPNVSVNVLGDSPNVNLTGSQYNSVSVNVAEDASFGNISGQGGNANGLTTVNIADGGTVGNIVTGTDIGDRLVLTGGNDVTIGNITSGSTVWLPAIGTGIWYDQGGADLIQVGDNATIGDVKLYGGSDQVVAGDNLTIGNVELGDGQDSMIIGEGSHVTGHIATGTDTAVNDADYLAIGNGSVVDSYINTNTGNDTVIIGDSVTLNGGSNAINTYLGNDYVEIGSGVVAPNNIFTGPGSDTVVASPGGGQYTVDQGTVIPQDDLLIIQYTKAEYDDFMNALQTQGYRENTSVYGPDTYFSSSNSTFYWNGVAYTNSDWIQGQLVPCFSADALIETARGPVRAGDLTVGDMVRTRDAGMQPLRWVGRKELSAADLAAAPKLRPIRIAAGALGAGLPATDLVVSPQHRVLVRSKIAQKMFGTDEVLVAAKQLCQIEGIDIAADMAGVTYVHFLFDDHQIVFSNGAETESMFTGPEALKSVGKAAVEEIFAIFPELRDGAERPAARMLTSGRMARKLAVRHAQNNRPLVM
ncbi:MAG: Hint domain-containing protein [Paracoccus sp. (in: a-proteobacteria)]|uniref:Hint domain-containing protein n=1 Tax=Paracoccus sp. TaxID=267 RepID=UPI0026E04B90|nr:Hint domain-containing protein [Paracoccus sp. (in: a-proteobacteria)]MDO5620382.1 Hint domain-containing protein [Paracoccus sp. (in: a-proteobacteria)]